MGPVGSIEKIVTGNGIITNAPFFYEGSDTTFHIEAAAHHRISGIRTNGVSVGDLSHTVYATNYVWQVSSTGTLEAEFSPATYTLSVHTAHGTPHPGSLSAVESGSAVTQSVERLVHDASHPGIRYRATGAREEAQ